MDPRQAWRLARRAVEAWTDDYAPSMGAALSYYALFSIAPLLLIVIGVAGFFFGEEAARGEIFGQLNALIGAEGAHAVEGLLASARKPESGVLAVIIGTALLVMGASSVFGELQNALDRIWRAPARRESKGWWKLLRTRVFSFGMILGIAFLLMVSLVLSAVVSALGRWWGLHLVDLGLSFALTTALFGMIYKVIPRVRIAWRDVWVGAAVTAALFALGKWLIGLYIGKSSVSSAFGAAGSLVVLMLWVYYSAQIFLLGAEFTRVYAEEQGSHADPVARVTTHIRVQAAANSPVSQPARPVGAIAKLGAALALGIGASIGLGFLRRR
jgi:membrane protein